MALEAMVVLIPIHNGKVGYEKKVADEAYKIADHMMAQRKKRNDADEADCEIPPTKPRKWQVRCIRCNTLVQMPPDAIEQLEKGNSVNAYCTNKECKNYLWGLAGSKPRTRNQAEEDERRQQSSERTAGESSTGGTASTPT